MSQAKRDRRRADENEPSSESERVRQKALEQAREKAGEEDDDTPFETRFNLEWDRLNAPEGVRRERMAEGGNLPKENVTAQQAAAEAAKRATDQQDEPSVKSPSWEKAPASR
jgi:hypothetical protein